MRKALCSLLAIAVFVPSVAFAQENNSAARCAGASSTGAGARDQEFCFTGDAVRGTREGAGGVVSPVLRPRSGPSLIRHRAHFVPEMLKSVESI